MKHKNIVIAIDSFKGSLSSMEAGQAFANGVHLAFPEANIKISPLADGGEGTVDALIDGLHGKSMPVEVTGPLGEKIMSRYGLLSDGTAIIEMADAAGLPLVPKEKRNPLHTTTYGLGELILAAAHAGAREFIIGIGGSATNDCGIGMLTALGIKFLNQDGEAVGIYGRDITNIHGIELSGIDPVIKDCHFHIACDVNNPLYGPRGCSYVYGPQKGATPEIVSAMDESIRNFSQVVKSATSKDEAQTAGAGAAGGLGFAFKSFLPAELRSGIEIVLGILGIEESLKEADLLITGEGRMDAQTAMGKGPAGVAQYAKKLHPTVKTIAICGCASPDASLVNQHGIDAYFPILHAPMSVENAMEAETTKMNIAQTSEQILRLLEA